MSDLARPVVTPLWPRVVAIIGLLWSGYGLYLSPRFFEAVRVGSITPLVILCFAISLFGLMVGSLCLLLRPRWAPPFLLVALLGDLAWAIGNGGIAQLRLIAISTLVALIALVAAILARPRAQRP